MWNTWTLTLVSENGVSTLQSCYLTHSYVKMVYVDILWHQTYMWRHQSNVKYLNIDSGLGKRSLPVTNRFVQTGNSVLKKIVGSICCLEKKIIIWRMWNCFKNVKYRVNSKITSFIVERWFMWCFSNKVFWGFVFELRSGQLSYEAGFL
jgi:hypothetical protein